MCEGGLCLVEDAYSYCKPWSDQRVQLTEEIERIMKIYLIQKKAEKEKQRNEEQMR